MKKLKERPEPITRQENWDDYTCFLLERILDELVMINRVLQPPVETKPVQKAKTNTKNVTKSKG